jgi:hypothetical protein
MAVCLGYHTRICDALIKISGRQHCFWSNFNKRMVVTMQGHTLELSPLSC